MKYITLLLLISFHSISAEKCLNLNYASYSTGWMTDSYFVILKDEVAHDNLTAKKIKHEYTLVGEELAKEILGFAFDEINFPRQKEYSYNIKNISFTEQIIVCVDSESYIFMGEGYNAGYSIAPKQINSINFRKNL